MKGIIIIGFNKSPGAYIETQYPPNISSDVGLEPTDLMNIYALHRMRKMKPDYQKIKIKNIDIASFYTGFSVQRCVGYPDKVITVILSEEEEITTNYEPLLMRYAYEVLPSINDPNFAEFICDFYKQLKAGDIRPYIENGFEFDDELELSTVSSGTLSDQTIASVIESHAIDLDDLDFVNQFKELEDEEDLHEIENLREYIKEQEITMNTLAEEIVEHNIMQDALEQQLETLTEHFQSQNARIEQLANTNISLKEKISKLRVTTTKSVDTTQILEELEDKIIKLETESEGLRKTVKNLENDKKILEEKLKQEKEAKPVVEKVIKKEPIKAKPKPKPKPETKPKTKAEVIAKAAASKDDGIREKWLSMGLKPLQSEISKSNMNVIRRIVKPWKIKPKGRKKQDLVNATLEFIKKKK